MNQLKNISENFGVEDTTNIILKVIKNNRQASLNELLKIVNRI